MESEIHRGYVIRARRGYIDASDQGLPAEFGAGIDTSGKLGRAGGDKRVVQVELGLGCDRTAVVYRPVHLCWRDS